MPTLQRQAAVTSPIVPAPVSTGDLVGRVQAGRIAYRPWLLFVLAILPFAGLVAAQWRIPPAGIAGDYAQYLLHAQAIADGRPYGDIGYIATRFNPLIGPAAQPPVWPVMLAPIVGVFGVHGDAPRVFSLLIMLAFLATVFRYFVRREELVVAVAIVAVLGIGMERSYLLATPLSDPPFLLIVWLALSAADANKEWTWPRIALLGSLAVLATGTRVSGVALLPALVVASLSRSAAERRRVLTLAAVGGLALIALLVLAGDHIPFWRQLVRPPEVLLQRVQRHLLTYRFAAFEALLYPFSSDRANDVYHAASAVVTLIGVSQIARRYLKTTVGAFTACYTGLLLISPVMDTRYTWPLWPLALCAFVVGLRYLLTIARLPACSITPVLGLLVLVIAAFSSFGAASRPKPVTLLDHPATAELFAWVEASPAKPSMRALFFNPRVFTLHTGVPAMGPFNADAPRTERELDRLRINTVILGSLGLDMPGQERLLESTAWLRESWTLAFQNTEFSVYVRPDSIQSGRPGVTMRQTS